MIKTILTAALLSTSLNANSSIILQDGDSYSTSFNLASVAEGNKFTDNFWEVIVGIYDRDNDPFKLPVVNPSTVTLTMYENTNLTNQVYSETIDTRFWLGDYGVLFSDFNTLFTDFNGSLTVTFNGGTQATLLDITIANFAGTLTPSNIASTYINPKVSAVPVPAAVWLFGSGLLGLAGFSRRRK